VIEAAGILFLSDVGRILFIKRSDTGEWAIPGGKIEFDETPEQAAIRECEEEIGIVPMSPLALLWRRMTEQVDFTTYLQNIAEFIPTLNEEHTAFMWRRADNPPEPLHPGVAEVLDMRMTPLTVDREMKFYTTEQLGPKQSLTPEGYLLIEDVPIGRLGTLYYRGDGEEVSITSKEGSGGIVQVTRDAEELFSDECLASFAGKPLTLDHPPPGVDINPDNHRLFSVGMTLHPRRGVGVDDDLMLADLLVTDPDMIQAIRDKKIKEISSGYDCEYVQTAPGRGRQTDIRGNHVAFVDKGRCGPRCSVGDSAMAIRKVLTNTVANMFAPDNRITELREAFASKDEDAFEAVLKRVLTVDAEPVAVHVHAPAPEDDSPDMGDVLDMLGTLVARLDDMDGTTTDSMKDGRMKDSYRKTMDKRMADRAARDADAAAKEETKRKEMADKAMADAAEGKEPEDDDKKEPDKKKTDTKDAMGTRDSTALEVTYHETLSRAEILAPGLKFPTYDRRADFKLTNDALCALRRRALAKAITNEEALDVIRPLTTDSPDLKGMACDKVEAMFTGASELMKLHNAMGKARDVRGTQQAPADSFLTYGIAGNAPSPAEINARNRANWAART
jgi:8-oxo-dGTP pyrophosphatase MutT (NUDIX family)